MVDPVLAHNRRFTRARPEEGLDGNEERARHLLQALHSSYGHGERYRCLGMVLYLLGDGKEAFFRLWREHADRDQSSLEGPDPGEDVARHTWMGFVTVNHYRKETGDGYQSARSTLGKWAAMYPRDPDGTPKRRRTEPEHPSPFSRNTSGSHRSSARSPPGEDPPSPLVSTTTIVVPTTNEVERDRAASDFAFWLTGP